MEQTADESIKTVRLHITPFSPALLSVYLPSNTLPLASDISYHTFQTFPDRPFGYVTLPVMEANKLKKKLNGTILKGSKVEIEDARPSKRKSGEVNTEETVEEKAARKKAKKEKRLKKNDDAVLEGHELESGRKVKRGWTEGVTSADKKDKKKKKETGSKAGKKDRKKVTEKSKYTKESELLFKTTLPPNKVPAQEKSDSKKDGKKKSKKSTKEVVVHEFENTRKHSSFLKQATNKSNTKPANDFVEGKGWVDEDGNIVEEVKPQKPKNLLPPVEIVSKTSKKSKVEAPTPAEASPKKSSKRNQKAASPSPESSSSESESDSDSDSSLSSSASSSSSPEQPAKPEKTEQTEETKLDSSKSPHPLESLFKRRAGTDLHIPIYTSFNFFGGNDENEDDPPKEPQTPFSRHVDARHISRSGAPTPETAAVNRRFSFSRGVVDREDDSENEDDEPVKRLDAVEEDDELEDEAIEQDEDNEGDAQGNGEESTFAKWFWEKRGDNNRAWKARRAEAMREKRRRENKRIGRRVV